MTANITMLGLYPATSADAFIFILATRFLTSAVAYDICTMTPLLLASVTCSAVTLFLLLFYMVLLTFRWLSF